MHFITTVCLLSVAVIAAFAQTDGNCHLCEVVVNEVLALHPGGLNGVPDAVLMADLNNECEKYWSQDPTQDQGCHAWVTKNGASFIAAMRTNSSAYAVCHAPPASVC